MNNRSMVNAISNHDVNVIIHMFSLHFVLVLHILHSVKFLCRSSFDKLISLFYTNNTISFKMEIEQNINYTFLNKIKLHPVENYNLIFCLFVFVPSPLFVPAWISLSSQYGIISLSLYLIRRQCTFNK